MSGLAGGFGGEKPADDEVRGVFETESVRAAVAGHLGHAVDSLVVQSYQTQVVRAVPIFIACLLFLCLRAPGISLGT